MMYYIKSKKKSDDVLHEFLIDWDTCDFNLTVSMLTYCIPCEIRRSKSGLGYHIKSNNPLSLNFDDDFRLFLRELDHPMVFFKSPYEWVRINEINDFLEVNI